MTRSVDVAVIGAGAAGLLAARELVGAGARVVVLEARARTGGRILTARPAGADLPIELGAEFLHGDAPVTRALLDEYGLRHVAGTGDAWRAERGRVTLAPDHFRSVGRVLARIDTERADESFADFIARAPGGRTLARARRDALRFIEGFHAADASRISAHSVSASPEETAAMGRSARVLAGYDALTTALAAELGDRVRLRAPVRALAWRRGRCDITWQGRRRRETIAARAALVTVPVGVLTAPDGIAITPEPAPVARARRQLAMGDVVRIGFVFRERFWESLRGERGDQLAFLHTPRAVCQVWWTQYPVAAPLLIAWAGGPAAARLRRLDPATRAARALAGLADATGRSRASLRRLLVDWHTCDWSADPFSRGAYSYSLAGGADAGKALARPVEGTLFFAGEASAPASGTVEGALASGRRAARAALRALD